MKIHFAIKSDLINADEKKYLMTKLRTDEANIESVLNEISKAALSEFLVMLKGGGVPNNIGKLLEDRFNCLMKYYFKTRIPDENELKLLFKISKTKAKNILETCSNNVLMEHSRIELIKSILTSAEKDEDYFHFVIAQDFILDELRNGIETDGKKLEQISPVKNSTRKFQCHIDTYTFLKKRYGIK